MQTESINKKKNKKETSWSYIVLCSESKTNNPPIYPNRISLNVTSNGSPSNNIPIIPSSDPPVP